MDVKNLKIDLVGIGGIGGWLMPPVLTFLNHEVGRAGKKGSLGIESVSFTVIDGDKFETRNADRQAFHKLGFKAEVTVERVRSLFPNLLPTAKNEYIVKKNVARMIKEDHIVLLAVDNHRTRLLISEQASTLDNVVVISGGNTGVEIVEKDGVQKVVEDGTRGDVQVYIREDGKDKLLPLANSFHPEIINAKDVNPGEAKDTSSCQVMVAVTPQLVPTNFNVASLMFNALYGVLIGKCDYDECRASVVRNQCNPIHRTNPPKVLAGRK